MRVIPRLCGHRNVGQLLMRLLLRIGKKNDRLFAEAGNRGTFNTRGARPDIEHASVRGYREG